MKKGTLILITLLLLMVIGYSAYNTTINLYGNSKIAENISDFKVYISSLKVNGNEVSGINGSKDGFVIDTPVTGTIEYEITNDSTEYDTEASLECTGENINIGKIWNYDYTGGEQLFTAPEDGTYKLETWGAQGGSIDKSPSLDALYGGYGGYSVGTIELKKDETIYINVGGKGNACLKYGTTTSGSQTCGNDGGYNGGGSTRQYINSTYYGSGGGATSVSKNSGKLMENVNQKSSVLIVAGGGGGATVFMPSKVSYASNGGSAGGYIGSVSKSVILDRDTNCTGGNQVSGGTGTDGKGTFGLGASIISYVGPGGGGGYFGGGTSETKSCGGSGYIGNTLLTEKTMYCYNCSESNEILTKTISTTCTNLVPTENCSKQGNGYARITLNGTSKKIITDKVNLLSGKKQNYSINNIETSKMTCNLKLSKTSRTEPNNNSSTNIWNYDYTGGEQTFIAAKDGTYKLETWGAQGGSIDKNKYTDILYGGYGGYSVGTIKLKKGQKLYINVGGQGNACLKYGPTTLGIQTCGADGGYNGGGSTRQYTGGTYYGSGGGATHVSITSGLLSNLENDALSVLIVSGGGGGATEYTGSGFSRLVYASNGGTAGGYVGSVSKSVILDRDTNCTGGTQTTGGTGTDNFGTFGIGASIIGYVGPGGGGGYFGGGTSETKSCGGSGYIGNTLLTNKSMYCYNCSESNEILTKTISTTCTSSTPKENCAKIGNGYARITLISID